MLSILSHELQVRFTAPLLSQFVTNTFRVPSMIDANVSPSKPRDAQPTIGIIGMGVMGRMYANLLSEAGWLK